MTVPYLRNILLALQLFLVFVRADLNISGETITTRFWDCCKPSCSWKGKAEVSRPVQDCQWDDAPSTDINGGTGCGEGGGAYTCNNQQPWAINDTLSYGFAGVFITGHPEIESFWCCACYQLDFTSEPLKGKSMIVQASNTAYDVKTTNRFSLAIPGGNTTRFDGCTKQYNVNQTVFGNPNSGVGSLDACNNLPEKLQAGCRWRFDWFQDAQYPSANFKRVVCPSELTDRTKCVRKDEQAFAEGRSFATSNFCPSAWFAMLSVIFTSFILA
ncbi:endoglucanase 1 precursor [Westerdykella ornata]|uniref:cellulase n=1 Tax=Westerdykella ornata TaxID=318751 RepID=A0A6A6J9T6_WESOR|nr:endoglucanase 1 precursor [Westerdykella ornata]KAF2272933.1 endoglucanase 1 precursor [Westerdykella ornata]